MEAYRTVDSAMRKAARGFIKIRMKAIKDMMNEGY